MAEESETTPLLSDPINKILRLCKDMQQFQSSTTVNDEGDVVIHRLAAVKGGVDIDKAGNSADGDNGKEHPEEPEVELEEALRKKRLAMKKFLQSSPPRRASNLARFAAFNSRTAAYSCRHVMNITRNAIDLGKKQVNEALRRAEESLNLDEATHCRLIASKYDAAIKQARKRILPIEVAIESAENASIDAEAAANEIARVPDEADIAEAEERVLTANWSANTANMAAIVAYKAEYMALKAMKKCWQDLDTENVEAERYKIRIGLQRGTRRRGVNKQEQIASWCYNGTSLIFGILTFTLVLTNVHSSDSPKTVTCLITIASLLVTIPTLYFLYKVFTWCRNRRREAKQREELTVIAQINERLREIEEYFAKHKTSPLPSEAEDLEEST